MRLLRRGVLASCNVVVSCRITRAARDRHAHAAAADSPAPTGTAVQAGVLEYVLNLVGVYALATAIDVIGASVGGQRNRVQALKVAAYGSTPYWLAGAFALFPRIEPLAMLLGLYSVRLFALGLSPCMKVPRDKTAAFTLLTSIAAGLMVLVITAIITRLVVA